MHPHYLIDGYNLIHLVSDLQQCLDRGLEEARTMLIHYMQSYLAAHQVRMTIVFDGDNVGRAEPPVRTSGRLKIIYSTPPEKADPVIKRLIDTAKNRRAMILVSADHELIRYGTRSGVQILSPQQFYERLRQPIHQESMDQKFNSKLFDEELADWLKLFGAPDQ